MLTKFNFDSKDGISRELQVGSEASKIIKNQKCDPEKYFDWFCSAFDITIEPFYELILAYKKRFDFQDTRKIILNSHGTFTHWYPIFKSNRWVYSGRGFFPREVQEWVDENDTGGLLYLAVCNPGNQNVRASNSLVIYPCDTFSLAGLENGQNKLKMYFPNIGVVSEDAVDETLQNLEERLF